MTHKEEAIKRVEKKDVEGLLKDRLQKGKEDLGNDRSSLLQAVGLSHRYEIPDGRVICRFRT